MAKRDKSYDTRRKRPSKGFAQITYSPLNEWLEAVPKRYDKSTWRNLVFTTIMQTDKMKYFGEGRPNPRYGQWWTSIPAIMGITGVPKRPIMTFLKYSIKQGFIEDLPALARDKNPKRAINEPLSARYNKSGRIIRIINPDKYFSKLEEQAESSLTRGKTDAIRHDNLHAFQACRIDKKAYRWGGVARRAGEYSHGGVRGDEGGLGGYVFKNL